VEEHSINLLLQGGNHGEELLLSGGWWLLVRGGHQMSQTLFGHISTNSLMILMVLMAMESP